MAGILPIRRTTQNNLSVITIILIIRGAIRKFVDWCFKELGPKKEKLDLLLNKIMKYEIIQLLLNEYIEEGPNCV